MFSRTHSTFDDRPGGGGSMTLLPPAKAVLVNGQADTATHAAADDTVVLSYDERLLRRKRLTTVSGKSFQVDLPETVSLTEGDLFQLEDGRLIRVSAAAEELLEIRGDLPRMSWHIGNRHTPCQIEADRMLIRRDPVLQAMLVQLGAAVLPVTEPFTPEGGAYGFGRTMGHSHAPDTHDHGAHDHGPRG